MAVKAAGSVTVASITDVASTTRYYLLQASTLTAPAKPTANLVVIFEFWNGQRWTGIDVPDFPATLPPSSKASPFIMLPEGVGRLYAIDALVDGPFPEHYEPTESPTGRNPLHPSTVYNPTVRIFPYDQTRLGTAEQFPYVATTYSITELFRHWTKHSRINACTNFFESGSKGKRRQE